jgi:hypothetical protein
MVEVSDFIDPETIDFETGEVIDMGDNLGLHGGAISDWDILAQDFTAEAKELGEFKCSLLHTS